MMFHWISLGVLSALLCLSLGESAEIIGGQEVTPHSLPHMALLLNKKDAPVCGGTLIDRQWVLTAAHCLDIKKVTLGVHNWRKKEKESQVMTVKKTFTLCYDKEEMVDDIMLLKLNKKVKNTFKPLPVPSQALDVPAGTTCLVAGWGATKNQGDMSDVLRSVNVTVLDRVKCNTQNFYNYKPLITNNMICAGSEGKDTCQGDSGGPLVCGGVLRGVTSFGHKCGLKTKPGVYTLLTKKYLDWIEKTIN